MLYIYNIYIAYRAVYATEYTRLCYALSRLSLSLKECVFYCTFEDEELSGLLSSQYYI